MKLKEYAKKIATLARAFPNASVVYSIDDEGNDFREIQYQPSQGLFIKDGYNGEFQEAENSSKVNAICIN